VFSLAALVLVCFCAQARAAPPLTVFEGDDESPLSDGGRWAVIPLQGGMVVVDGRTLTRRPVALAGPCGSQFGAPRGVGAGLVVVECAFRVNQTSPRVLVYDLVAQTFTEVPGTEILTRGSDGFTIGAIGRSWIAFGLTLHHGGSTPGLLNWRTGVAVPEPALAADRVTDLDAHSATRPLCRGIRRPSTRKRLFAYRPPFAISERAAGSRRRLVLERCHSRAITLETTSRLAGVSLGTRAVAWVQGDTIHARSLRSGREWHWPAPLGKPVLSLAQAGSHLLVTIVGGPKAGPQGPAFTVYSGPLP
jgi:hypothetical protein